MASSDRPGEEVFVGDDPVMVLLGLVPAVIEDEGVVDCGDATVEVLLETEEVVLCGDVVLV